MFYIPFVLILPASVYGIGQPHYECGENGRFEYCIDGIPGCVIGCHCHPGYYFDTETKICEPNAKLVQEYRRLYSGVGPTRVPEMIMPANELDLEPTPTTSSPLDAQVENIAKDDDLGDWLYNQFFKTIESQVINSTDGTESPKPETRRSNNDGSTEIKPKRRRQKKSKKVLLKKGTKKKTNLRRKLLRITEDDSLFDSSSANSEDSSDASDSSSSDSSSDTSSDGDYSNEKNNSRHDHNDKEHGHRRILFINKKPKPPLPSFIFLPNMETPYFSPIGLAPPPIPMYPIVPVPPMPIPPMPMQPMFPPVPATCTNNKTTEKENNGVNTTTAPTSTTTTTETTPKPPARSGKHFYRTGGNKREQRKKILRELQQMKSTMQMQKKTPESHEIENNFDSQLVEEKFRADSMPPPPPVKEPPPENVDFKYLAQLIHKMDNKTFNTKPNISNDPNLPRRRFAGDLVNDYYQPPADNSVNFARRQFDTNRHLETPDESYYTNLGHQIASLIRKIDATGEQRVNIEIERQKASQPVRDVKSPTFEPTSFMMESNYAPRSYWERSVRSLLSRLQADDDYYPRKTHEDSLINLERKVENFATTARSLSLNDLENVVVLIDKTKNNFQRNTEIPVTATKTNDDNLNINLLPHPYENSFLEQNINSGIKRTIPNLYVPKVENNSEIMRRLMSGNKAQNNLRGVLLHNFQPQPKIDLKNTFNNNNILNQFDMKSMPAFKFQSLVKLDHNLRSLPNHKPQQMVLQNVTLNRHDIASLRRIVDANMDQVVNKRNKLPNVPWLGPKLANILSRSEIYHKSGNTAYLRQPLNRKLAAREHNYQSNKYYVDSNNRYQHHEETVAMPLQMQRARTLPQPSVYFHHEIQHLDTFDK